MSEALDFLQAEHPEAFELAAWTRGVVLDAEPDFAERVYRGWRGVGFRHPEAGYVCGIFPRGARVDLLFERGATLVDPERRLEGQGTQTRVLPVRTSDAETAAAIRTLVQQAVAQQILGRIG